jgi:2-desacetyl-2-hydroxyethyl bacteriochlorophyllide A dehydrogenase
MKALQLTAVDELNLVEIDRPQLKPNQILVRTGASTICTSDLHDIRANPFNIDLPVIIGHESAGVVMEVGAEVQGIRLGDHVAAHPVHPCGRCTACKDGKGHLCLDMEHFGLNMQGTFAQYFVVRADRVHLIPDDLDFTTGALMEPVCVCLEALHQARLKQDQTLLIIGDGPFGVLMTRLATTFDPARVVLAGQEDFRLGFAPSAVRVNTRTTPGYLEHLRSTVEGAGFDAAIVAVAAPEAVDDALELVKPMGRVVLFAPLPGKTPVDLFKVLLKELEVVGSVNDQDHMDEAVQMLTDPTLALGELVTHRFAIDDYRQAFTLAEHGREQAMKIALTFQDIVVS